MHYLLPSDRIEFGSAGTREFAQLNITFSTTDSIEEFERSIYNTLGVELDLEGVKAKKNFATISNLSRFLITSLIVFAILSILLFLYHLLKNHLESIKMNLGTFMAFGLSEKFLYRGYLFLVFRMLISVVFMVLCTLVLIRFAMQWHMGNGGRVPEMFAFVEVLRNSWLGYSLLALFVSAFAICSWQLKRFLSNTPGDLIYARK